jgi:hypothetical protein
MHGDHIPSDTVGNDNMNRQIKRYVDCPAFYKETGKMEQTPLSYCRECPLYQGEDNNQVICQLTFDDITCHKGSDTHE